VKSLHPLPDYVSGLTAETVETSTHGFSAVHVGFSKGNTTSINPKSFIGNPSALPRGGRNPDSSSASRMNNRQSPFGFQIDNVTIWNQDGVERVHDAKVIVQKHNLWSYPSYVNDASEEDRYENLKENLNPVINHQEAVQCEKSKKQQSHTCPDKVTSWSESFAHSPIIAGESK
jgi:hypothetical protein